MTICYGFNLKASGAEGKIEHVGGDWNKVMNDCSCPSHGGCLSQSQCTELLSDDVAGAAVAARGIFGLQCDCVMAVLTDMTYNLGAGQMATFGTFISLIKSHQWAAAANDARGTAWCRQVGGRCARDTGIIAKGC